MKKENILKQVKTSDVDLILLKSVDSTNDYLKNLARKGTVEKTVVIAETQSDGKGTKNRTFISDQGGVYMSILIKPSLVGFDATAITPMTAVAVSETIDKISGKNTQIKWVNDIYLNGKKVCGILCESVIDTCGKMPYIIVGIGVNLFKPANDFKDEIKDIATSVFDTENIQIKEEFIASLIDTFFTYYSEIFNKTFLKKYREKNLVLGRGIKVIQGENYQNAKALEIDDNCRLIVEFPNKTIKTLSSGEVTIRI